MSGRRLAAAFALAVVLASVLLVIGAAVDSGPPQALALVPIAALLVGREILAWRGAGRRWLALATVVLVVVLVAYLVSRAI